MIPNSSVSYQVNEAEQPPEKSLSQENQENLDEIERPDKPEEACGVFGIYAPGEDVAKLTYFGLFA